MSGLTTESLATGIRRMAAKIEASADELNRLDGAIGDGDLGVTMHRGMQGLVEEIPNLPEDLGQAFLKCAQVFTRVSGSTFGTLLATALMSAGKATRGQTEVPWQEAPALIGGAIEEMARRGKGALGDKTVLDALDAAKTALEGVSDPAAMLPAADAAVAATLDRLRDTPARQGRARILAERSVGLDDPGMIAVKRLIEGLLEGNS